jgi:hypothetical protein
MTKSITWIAIIIICSIAIVLTFSFAQSQQITPCVEHWETLTADEKAACDEKIGSRGAVLATRDALQEQTVQALPSAPPLSGLATEAAIYEERGSPTPDTVGTTTARSTERMEVIKRVEPQETAGGGVPLSLDYRFMGSVWRVGAIEDNRGMLHPFYVSAPQDVCGLITVTIGMGEDLPHAEDAWPCPQNTGAITIEDATGPTGIVTFTDTLSRTGTFDLSTKAWTREGQLWLPETTPTP